MKSFLKISFFIIAMITTLEDVASSNNNRVNAFVSTVSMALPSAAVSGVSKVAPVANVVAKPITNSFTYTKSAGKHLTDVIKHGANKGELARPYMKSPLTIQEIMSTGKGINTRCDIQRGS